MKKLLLSLGTLASVASPIAVTISCGDESNDASLENARALAIKQIGDEKELSQEQKDGFVEKLNEAKTDLEILEIVDEANAKDLDIYKEIKTAYVNGLDEDLEELSDANKLAATISIGNAKTKASVDEFVNNLFLSALEKYKASEIKEIKNVDKLDENTKDSWINKLDAAKDMKSAKNIMKQFMDFALENAKANALTELNSYSSLSDEQKNICETGINSSKNIDELNEAIKHMQTLAFDEVKNQAKAKVEGYNDWSDAEKLELKSAIDSAKDVKELNAKIEAAKLKHAKAEATDKINLMNLSDDEKDKFNSAINKVTDPSETQSIVDEALLQQAKNKASLDIDKFQLSIAEKANFNAEVDKATTLDEVKAALDAASTQQDKNVALQNAKDNASKTIEGYQLSIAEKANFNAEVDKATTPAEVKTALDAALAQQDKNVALQNAKDNASKTIDAYKITDLEKDKYKSDIDKATDISNIQPILDDALLQQAKEKAISNIEGLTLKESEKAQFESDINKVTDSNAIQSIVNSAMEQEAKEVSLQQAIDTAIKALDGYEISDSEKNKFKSDISKVTGSSDIRSILDAALLQQAKEKASSDINNFQLSTEEKANFNAEVDKATTLDEVKAALDSASTQQDKNVALQNAKDNASKTIEGYQLSTEEKADFNAEVNKATTPAEVKTALDAALAQQDKNIALQNAKDDASKTIEGYQLSVDEKANFNAEVDKATTPAEVKAALDAASTQQDKNVALQKAKDDASKVIDNYKLSGAEKALFKSNVTKATTPAEVKTALDAALAQQDKNIALQKAKDDASKAIEGYQLSADEKVNFNAEVDKATTLDEVKAALDAASTQQDKNVALQNAKDDASKVIDNYKLSDAEKALFKSNVTKATTPAEVKTALDAALAQQDKNVALQKAKDDASKVIDNYKLSDAEKALFKSNVTKATTPAEVKTALDAALAQQDKNVALQNAKDAGIKTIYGFKNMGSSNSNAYKAKVNSATTISSVNLIVQEAQIVDANLVTDVFNVTLNGTNGQVISGLSLGLDHTLGLSNSEKAEVIKELISKQLLKIDHEYDSKYGDEIPMPSLEVHGNIIPGIHHKLHEMTDDEKIIYVDSVFEKMFINNDDTTPDLMPLTTWGLQFTAEQANICPALNKGGWYLKQLPHECLHGDIDGLLTMETLKKVSTADMHSKGVALKDFPPIFKIQFFNNIFYPTYYGYQHEFTENSLSQVITDETKFVDGPNHTGAPIKNDLVINGEHFKVSHISNNLIQDERAAIYNKLVKSISSLTLMRREEVKKVSSYNLSDSEKQKLMNSIATATTTKQISDLVNVAKSK